MDEADTFNKPLAFTEEEKALALSGRYIEAIRAVRVRTGCGLKEGADLWFALRDARDRGPSFAEECDQLLAAFHGAP